jgi:predicted AAA+ superfamily ATPase
VLEASQQVFLLEPYHRQRTKRLIKAPKLFFADTGLLCHMLGFRDPQDLPGHALWGAVWENFVVSETRKRLLDTGRPPACWFWRTAHGDEVDLIIETSPERFYAVEAKTAERVSSDGVKGLRKLAEEYGAEAVTHARIACRTDTPYPLDVPGGAQAVPVGGAGGLLDEVGRLFA